MIIYWVEACLLYFILEFKYKLFLIGFARLPEPVGPSLPQSHLMLSLFKVVQIHKELYMSNWKKSSKQNIES